MLIWLLGYFSQEKYGEAWELCAGCWNSFAWNLCCISNWLTTGGHGSGRRRITRSASIGESLPRGPYLPRRLGAMFERCQVGSQPYGTAMVTIPQQRPDSLWATAWWCTVPSQWWECSIHVIHVTNIYQHHPIPIIYISWLLHNTHTHVWKNMMNMSYLIHWLTDCFIIRTYSYYPIIGPREKTYWKPHFQWVRPGFPVDFCLKPIHWVLVTLPYCWLHSHYIQWYSDHISTIYSHHNIS